MHCQHVNGFLLVLENFSFLPHILQQRPTICRFCCVFVFKSILLFAAAAIPRRQALQTTYRIHARLFTILQQSLLLANDCFNFFNIIVYRPNSIYLKLKVLFTFGLLLGLICSFRKDILSSIICCRVVITIYTISLMKPSQRWMVITQLALKGKWEWRSIIIYEDIE